MLSYSNFVKFYKGLSKELKQKEWTIHNLSFGNIYALQKIVITWLQILFNQYLSPGRLFKHINMQRMFFKIISKFKELHEIGKKTYEGKYSSLITTVIKKHFWWKFQCFLKFLPQLFSLLWDILGYANTRENR